VRGFAPHRYFLTGKGVGMLDFINAPYKIGDQTLHILHILSV
jgi:hypothetical protein